MTRRILLAIAGVFFIGIGYFVWSFLDTWRRLPEAYAAWDTGTLLICYMDRNEKRWPKNWEDLTSIIRPDDPCVFCRGVEDGEDRANGYPKTIAKLKTMVRIDWGYVPLSGSTKRPVSRIDGSPFPVIWAGAEPNEMIYNYLTHGIKDEGRPM